MREGLRIKLEEALKAKYPYYLDLDEVENICKTYKYKISNLERRTRNDSKAQGSTVKCQKIYNDKHTAIIGYRWIPSTLEKMTIKRPTSPLNDELQKILSSIPPQELYARYDEVRAINNAIRSDNEYVKKSLINKYYPARNPL